MYKLKLMVLFLKLYLFLFVYFTCVQAELLCNNNFSFCYENITDTKLTQYYCAFSKQNELVCHNKFTSYYCDYINDNGIAYSCVKYYSYSRYLYLAVLGYFISGIINLVPIELIKLLLQIIIANILIEFL